MERLEEHDHPPGAEAQGPQLTVYGYVLAGGASRRMGSDKARLPHGGRAAAVHLVALLEAAGLRAKIVRRGPSDGLPWIRDDGSPIEVVREPDDGPRHPLNGVVSALEDAGAPVLVVPCDVLGLGRLHIEALLGRHSVAEAEGHMHPLVAHLQPGLLERARELVRSGGAARALVEGLPHVPLPPAALRDRNTAEGPWPMDRLASRLAWLGQDAFARIARSERTRQRAVGVVDPSANRYARDLPDKE